METDTGPGCVQPDGDSAALLAEFRMWLDRERGLSPVSVRCYSKQSKAFLAGIGGAGAVSELDAGRVTAFMVGWTQGRNTWSAKAMVTSLRAFLRFAQATGRTAAPLAGAVPAVASWRVSSLPRGLKAAEVERLLADPARLAITDSLLAGDASPSELAGMLAMPSNLLAHHLHVLEHAGVITRRRSEGDRRRTYLRLIPGALDSLAVPPARRRGGCCSCAPPTRRARTWPPRYGAGPAASRRFRPAPIRQRRSIPARSPPPGATGCHCPGCGPGTSATSRGRATS